MKLFVPSLNFFRLCLLSVSILAVTVHAVCCNIKLVHLAHKVYLYFSFDSSKWISTICPLLFYTPHAFFVPHLLYVLASVVQAEQSLLLHWVTFGVVFFKWHKRYFLWPRVEFSMILYLWLFSSLWEILTHTDLQFIPLHT
jgi:hypothetical protein